MKKGFTAAELIIVLGIVGVLLGILFMGVAGSCDAATHGQEMSRLASETATEMGYQDVVAICDGVDTDGDGKVSCTVTYSVPGGTRTSIPFVCPSRWSRSSTCQIRGPNW